jgi:hypothetical protein
MPGRPITDQQHRYYMTLRKTHPQKTAAAIAGRKLRRSAASMGCAMFFSLTFGDPDTPLS